MKENTNANTYIYTATTYVMYERAQAIQRRSDNAPVSSDLY